MSESILRQDVVHFSRSLFQRGLSAGSSGNISVRLDDGFLITPTNSCLGDLAPERLAKLDDAWGHVSGDQPSKEIFLHRAFYETRPTTGAVVHLHSTYATALSCLADVDPKDCIPPITPYVVMRVGTVPLLPYLRPGSSETRDLIGLLDGKHAAVLLANHGPVVSAGSLAAAVYAAEELEETARLVLLTRGLALRYLDRAQIDELKTVFGNPS